MEDWQQAALGCLFGWQHRETGLRRYKELFLFVPRKNGKTPVAAGIILDVMMTDHEPGAEIYGAAAEGEQAGLVFAHAKGMVAQDADLKQRLKIYESYPKTIAYEEEMTSYKAVSAEAFSKHGYNTHLYVIDELHAHRDGELLDVFETSTGARRQPLGVIITTSDFERPGSPCNAKQDYASKVRDGIITDLSFLPVIYEASRDDDWKDPATWEKANPNLDVSVSREYIERECRKAVEDSVHENRFKRLHLNVRTEQAVRWLPMDMWAECAGDVNPEELRGAPCCAGLDLASTSDITAFVMAFPVHGKVKLLPMFWVPKSAIQKRGRHNQHFYAEWVRKGLMRVTEGNTTDYEVVRHDINELAQMYGIRSIAVDRLFQGAQLAGELMADGFEVVAFGQGFLSMAAPTLEFDTLVKSRRLEHGGNAVLKWMASNVSVKQDPAGNMKPDKAASTDKIDGIVAAIMAIGQMMITDMRGGSVYDTRGVLTFG